MTSIVKPALALTFAGVMIVAAAPASAQVATPAENQATATETFPYAHVNSAGPNGQCWIMSKGTTTSDMGFGYWGDCPAGAARPVASQRSRRATAAQARVTAPAESIPQGVAGTALAAPAAAASVATTAAAGAVNTTAAAANAATGAATDPFPFAHVNSPGPTGQCWIMSKGTTTSARCS